MHGVDFKFFISGFPGPDVKSKLLCEAESQGRAMAVTRGDEQMRRRESGHWARMEVCF